ncbi:hypothetical protein KR222_010050, partial [Zaprionus bogoriensis]
MEQHTLEPTDVTADATEAPAQATQITSIDGFFNRKRGRPPKNRFVEVYKSAQHTPQAIFTSFKLERSDQVGVLGLAAYADGVESPTAHSLRLGALASQNTSVDGTTASDLTPCRARRKTRPWTVDTQRDRAVSTKTEQAESRTPVPVSRTRASGQRSTCLRSESIPSPSVAFQAPFSQLDARGNSSERVSVVRAAGTFYPENASSATSGGSPAQGDYGVEQPEDLSMRPCQREAVSMAAPATTRNEPEASLKLLQFKQLLDLYQRQLLLPTFLAAASQPAAALDMRLLLENAAQQKMLLINAATAAGAMAAVTAATAAEAVTAPGSPAVAPTTEAAVGAGAKRLRARDQDIPTGYLKFRFNEDCGFERCGYRNHQSHFHCNRRDCHYSFCDKTRFVQHTARHERMDTLMGDDFRQYRANMRCAVVDCFYSTLPADTGETLGVGAAAPKKSSHFHCRKCDYVCTDSNKVVAHRRLHMRLEYVHSAGFRKISSNEPCESPGCTYALRHTHYHCNTCDCSVLSRAQLTSHRHRHKQRLENGH